MTSIDIACPHMTCLPPPASPAPMLSRRPSLGTDARHQSPALVVGMEFSILSLSYISS
jgi:hypothetical protein